MNRRKHKSDEDLSETPSKRSKKVEAETPPHMREWIIDPEMFATPSTRKLFSPAMPTSIGPTPQRDGRILGLFDLLEENNENSPSTCRQVNASEDMNIQATPSKKSGGIDTAKLGRTPTSTNKGTMLFVTPSKRRSDNAALGKTPTSVSRLQFSTPSFLRRAPLAAVDENGEFISPAPFRLPRKPLGRSLSSVVAGLRKLEEEADEDDMDALHEMENEEGSGTNPSNTTKPAKPAKPNDEILEPDSQAQQLLGGFDDDTRYDSAPEEALGRNGQPLRVYKKKGQKRTTRKVNMKPTQSKRPQQSTEEQSDVDDEDVPETQVNTTKSSGEPPLDLGSDYEFDPSEDEREEPKKKVPAKKVPTKKLDKTKKGEETKKGDKKEGTVKKAVRKVNELAHANFKRLKLKNHGAKGPAAGSRFRRRR